MSSESKKNFILNSIFFMSVIIWCFVFFKWIFPATLPFWLGLCIAFILRPIILWLSKSLHLHRRRTAVFVTVLFYFLIGILLWLFLCLVWGQLCSFAGQFPQIYKTIFLPALANFFEWLSKFLSRFVPDLAQTVHLWMQSFASSFSKLSGTVSSAIFSYCTNIASKIPLSFLTLIVTIFCSAFLSLDYPQVSSALISLVPKKIRPLLSDLKKFTTTTLLRLVKAYLLLLFITFAELCVGLWILKVPYFFSIAAFIALLDLLPILGTGTILIPWAIFSFFSHNSFLGVGLIFLYLAITIARNFWEPKIVGDCIGLPPLVSLISIYAGFRLFGVVGVLVMPLSVLAAIFLYQKYSKKLE